MRINELFEKHAKHQPFSKAVVCYDESITYQELDSKANQFAHYLQTAHQVKCGDVIGIAVAIKSINLIIAILGILKAGAAYQSLSTNHTANIALACVVTDNLNTHSDGININEVQKLVGQDNANPIPATEMTGGSVAYLISTSGTTGRPKTIAISHDNLTATFQSWQDVYQLTADDRHLQMANFSFDVFSGDWVRALCSGGTLVLCSKECLLHPQSLFSLIARNEITIAEFVPAVLRKLMHYVEEKQKTLSTFRVLICGSDVWYMGECKKIMQLCGPKTRIINSYGLSETTIDATYYEWSEKNDTYLKDNSIVPIGKAFPHAMIKVVDTTGKEAANGEQGEICIGGQGVSQQGYLNNPELTREKFIWSDEDSSLFYKTGDVAEVLENGDILFLGRNETQFNINGQRVDFLSVESVLLQHLKIKTAVVIPHESGSNHYLEAFLVLNADIDYGELTKYLNDHLPSYAIPKSFYEIERVILSNNNKIVRKKSQQEVLREIAGEMISPKTRTQSIVTDIWEKRLQKKAISIHDDFDRLAGTSLQYAEIVADVNKTFCANICLFKPLKTIVEMAHKVDAQQFEYPHQTLVTAEKCSSLASECAVRKFSLSDEISAKIIIKPMDKNDIKTIFHWAKREGWNPGLHDFQSYHSVDPNGFNMLWVDGKPVSTLASVRYQHQHSYGFLGIYIVEPEYRGYGYGKRLWDYSMKLIDSCRSIGLNAVLNQIPNYEKSGFKFSNFNTRWRTSLFNIKRGKRLCTTKARLSKNFTLQEVIEIDYKATSCYRPEFWQSMLISRHSYFLGARDEDRLVGFALISQCVDGYKFGPIYAQGADIAENLMTALWNQALQNACKADDTIQLDTSATNNQAEQLAKEYGFVRIYDTARMYRGEKPIMNDAIVYGSASLEIG